MIRRIILIAVALLGVLIAVVFVVRAQGWLWVALPEVPLIAVVIPALLIWRFWSKPVRPACRCGHNLAGNVSGVCPECGRNRWADL